MAPVRRRIPVDLARGDFHLLSTRAVTKFNGQLRSSKHNRHAVAHIAMPVCGFAWLQYEPADENVITTMQNFLTHLIDSLRFAARFCAPEGKPGSTG